MKNSPKENYQKKLDEVIKEIEVQINNGLSKPSLLLHACCGPCSSYVLEYLSSYFQITVLYYNPNIYPKTEYTRRFEELKKLYETFPPVINGNVKVVEIPYDEEDFYKAVKTREEKELAFEQEKGVRCERCYTFRLQKAFEYAYENQFDYFCTTLSISPFKDAEKINRIGSQIESNKINAIKDECSIYEVENQQMAAGAEDLYINPPIEDKEKKVPKWLYSDFKKKGGFKRSLEISDEYNMYRQEYCGCVYSFQNRQNYLKNKTE